MKYFIILFAVVLTGCVTFGQRSARFPLDVSFRSNREKTMQWMKENDPTGKVKKHGEEKFGKIYGDLIHEWSAGRLTVVLNEDESIRSKTRWLKQSENTFFSATDGYVIKIISDDEYYLEAHAPAGVFREYFNKVKH